MKNENSTFDWSQRASTISGEIEELRRQVTEIEMSRAALADQIVRGDVAARVRLRILGQRISMLESLIQDRALELAAAEFADTKQKLDSRNVRSRPYKARSSCFGGGSMTTAARTA